MIAWSTAVTVSGRLVMATVRSPIMMSGLPSRENTMKRTGAGVSATLTKVAAFAVDEVTTPLSPPRRALTLAAAALLASTSEPLMVSTVDFAMWMLDPSK